MRISGSSAWPVHSLNKQQPRTPSNATLRTRAEPPPASVTPTPAVTTLREPSSTQLGTMAYAHAVMRSGRIPDALADTVGPRHDRAFLWPAPGAPLPSRLAGYVRRGALAHRPHRGIDIMAPRGSSVIAPEDGVVLFARSGWNGGYGNSVILLHADGSCTRFAHLGSIGALTPGARVKRGAPIATVGNTGLSRGAHLHFEVWANGDWTSQRGRFTASDLRNAGATDAVIEALV